MYICVHTHVDKKTKAVCNTLTEDSQLPFFPYVEEGMYHHSKGVMELKFRG